jgi:epoxyqueuosine reductase QueG
MDNRSKNYTALKKFSLGLGADLFGVADVNQIKKDFLLSRELKGKFDKAISLGMRLSHGILSEIKDAPTRLYFHHYRTANVLLDQVAFKVSSCIEGKGYLAVPIPSSQILDWQSQKAHLSHKKIAYLAGLGWIGRNNLLVNQNLGCQFRLVTILTDMPLKLDKPLKTDCGDCSLCIEVCPAGAIKENSSEFDYLACFEKLKEFQKQRLVDQYVCGVCVKSCPGKKTP